MFFFSLGDNFWCHVSCFVFCTWNNVKQKNKKQNKGPTIALLAPLFVCILYVCDSLLLLYLFIIRLIKIWSFRNNNETTVFESNTSVIASKRIDKKHNNHTKPSNIYINHHNQIQNSKTNTNATAMQQNSPVPPPPETPSVSDMHGHTNKKYFKNIVIHEENTFQTNDGTIDNVPCVKIPSVIKEENNDNDNILINENNKNKKKKQKKTKNSSDYMSQAKRDQMLQLLWKSIVLLLFTVIISIIFLIANTLQYYPALIFSPIDGFDFIFCIYLFFFCCVFRLFCFVWLLTFSPKKKS